MKIENCKIENCKRGYTIIETMIAVSLFIVVVMAGMGSLLNANLLHNKSEDMRSILDNLSFIVEDMSRNLRTGYNYYCITGTDDLSSYSGINTTKSGSSCWGIAFEQQNGSTSNQSDQWVYYIDTSRRLWKSTEGDYDDPSVNYVQLNPNEVTIDPAVSGFDVVGALPGDDDNQQPFVTIRLVGKITYKPGTPNAVVTPFSLQTSVSQRKIDIDI